MLNFIVRLMATVPELVKIASIHVIMSDALNELKISIIIRISVYRNQMYIL